MYNHQLDTFIKTADLGSFGKAGEALYISITLSFSRLTCWKVTVVSGCLSGPITV